MNEYEDENARLREALEKIVKLTLYDDTGEPNDWPYGWKQFRDIARAALEEKP